MEMAKLFGLAVNVATVISGSSCALPISSFVFHVAAGIYTIVSGYHMLSMIVTHSDLFPARQLFENGWNEGEKHSHHLRNSHTRVLKSFLLDVPFLPRKGIVPVTAKRRVLQQENLMGGKI